MIAGLASVVVHAAAGYGLYVAPRIGDDSESPQHLAPGHVIVLPLAERTVELPPKPDTNPSPAAPSEPTTKPEVQPSIATTPVLVPVPPPQMPETEMLSLGTDNGQAGVKRWLEANAEGVHVALPGPDDQAGLTRRAGAVGVQPGQPGPVGTRGQAGEAGQGGQQGQAGSGAPMVPPSQTASQEPAPPQAPEQPFSAGANAAPPPPSASVPLPPPPKATATAPAAASRPVAASAAGPSALPVESQAVPASEEQFAAAAKDQAKSPLPVGPDRAGAVQPLLLPMQDPALPGEGAPLPPETRTAPTDKPPQPTAPTPPAPEPRQDAASTPPRPEPPAPKSPTNPSTKPPETTFGPLDLLLEETTDNTKRNDNFTPPLVLLPSLFDEALKRAAQRKSAANQPTQAATQSAAGGQPGAPGNAGKPGIPGDPGDSVAADAGEPGLQSDRESDAFSTAVGEYRAGKVVAGKGIEIRPTRPKFGLLARTLALPAPPRVEVVFGRNGAVKRARIVRSSGYSTEIDEPIINAVYEWTASGKALAELPPNPSAEMRLNLTVYLR